MIRCVRGGGLRESTRSVQVEATCGGEPREVTDEEEACNIGAYDAEGAGNANLQLSQAGRWVPFGAAFILALIGQTRTAVRTQHNRLSTI